MASAQSGLAHAGGGPPADAARPGLLPLLAGLAVLVVYIVTAGPSFYWLDSSELVAASWGLGIAHPPGHPLAVLLGRLLAYLPLGTISFRVTLGCALQAAAATVLVGLITHHLLARLRLAQGWPAQLGIAIAALSAGLSYAVWFQAVRAEVYALHLACIAAVIHLLLLWDSRGDRRALVAAALVGGLALCNHHLLVALALPACVLFVMWRRPAPAVRRAIAGVAAGAVLGLLLLGYLPLRARQDPAVNWGAPTTIERFGWVVSARLFQRTVQRVAASDPVSLRTESVLFAVMGNLGPLGALLSAGGMYLLWRRRQTRKPAALLTLVVAGNMTSALLVGFDAENADAHGYLATSVALLAPAMAVLIVSVLHAIRQTRARAAARWVGAAAALLLLWPIRTSLPATDLRSHWAAEETAREVLALPPGALLLTSYFKTVFNIWALQTAADLRPDVAVLHRNFLQQPGYADTAARQLPALAPLVQDWAAQGRVRAADLEELAHQRAVALEYDLNVPDDVTQRLAPAGLVLRYGQSVAAAPHQRRIQRWEQSLEGIQDIETRRSVVWTDYLLARFGCTRGLGEVAALHLRRVQQLAPADERVRHLIERCSSAR